MARGVFKVEMQGREGGRAPYWVSENSQMSFATPDCLSAIRAQSDVVLLSRVRWNRVPAEERKIPLRDIAKRTQLPLEGVEHLLMKTLSVSSTAHC